MKKDLLIQNWRRKTQHRKMELKTRRNLKIQNMSDDFPKFYKEISDEIVHLTETIKDEIQWLEQHCQKSIEACHFQMAPPFASRNSKDSKTPETNYVARAIPFLMDQITQNTFMGK